MIQPRGCTRFVPVSYPMFHTRLIPFHTRFILYTPGRPFHTSNLAPSHMRSSSFGSQTLAILKFDSGQNRVWPLNKHTFFGHPDPGRSPLQEIIATETGGISGGTTCAILCNATCSMGLSTQNTSNDDMFSYMSSTIYVENIEQRRNRH